MTTQRLAPEKRRENIINAFVDLAAANGYQTVTREQVAEKLDVSPALVTRYFDDSMRQLRDTVIQHCIDKKVLRVVVQAMAVNNPVACDAPKELKEQAAALLLL